ncbi:glycerophosphodiester phosphodiesterase [Microlunatus panaciterrae]|uniref:Glycerophosphoryl diester phosphodiesterase n=1 Tax=Microlunatus panaciterrae TaxID=400768 RepID=A0ABS2RGW1_9ACTN|nr:glycerophosphodiester phosphodiesterase family protein [Microlunatus panaciterrae]MBM7797164.1 glycerophosphoryl diester phosphodiesterase [Microlunatus panaciterrae]
MRAADYAYFDAPFLALAHRGGAADGENFDRENTLHAFGQAVERGYRYLETDVHATADGVLLAFHDDRLDRVTDQRGLIAELPYAQVAEARIAGRDAIPTLGELFTAFPQARFNIDAKAPAAVDLLADVIAEYEAYDRVCVSSFGYDRLHRLRRRLGRRVPSAASTRGVAWNRFAPSLTRLLNTPAAVLQLPITHTFLRWQLQVLTPALLRAAHRAGKQVHVWTIDDAPTIEWLLDVGVDGIFTDRIDTLKDVLTARGLWS